MNILEWSLPRRTFLQLGVGVFGAPEAIQKMTEDIGSLETVIAKQVFRWSIVVDKERNRYTWGVYRTEEEALNAYMIQFAKSDYSEVLKERFEKFDYKDHYLVGVGGPYKPGRAAGLITVDQVQGRRGEEKELRLDVSGHEDPYYWNNDQSIAFLSIRKQGGRIMVVDNIDIEFQEPPNFNNLSPLKR